MEANNPTFLLISSASAAALMATVFSYAKTISERRNEALKLEKTKIEDLKDTITNFIASVDLFFEHASQEFEHAEEIEVTDDYDKVSDIEIKYYKKTYKLDTELLDKLWSSNSSLRVKLATLGSDEPLDEIDKAMRLVRTVKSGEPFIRKQVPPIEYKNFKGSIFDRLLYFIIYPKSGIISGADIKKLKMDWEENSKTLLKSFKSTFTLLETRIQNNSKISDSLENISIVSIKIFMLILFAEFALYIIDYIPKLLEKILSLLKSVIMFFPDFF